MTAKPTTKVAPHENYLPYGIHMHCSSVSCTYCVDLIYVQSLQVTGKLHDILLYLWVMIYVYDTRYTSLVLIG